MGAVLVKFVTEIYLVDDYENRLSAFMSKFKYLNSTSIASQEEHTWTYGFFQ